MCIAGFGVAQRKGSSPILRDGKAVWLSGRAAGLRYVTGRSQATEIGHERSFAITATRSFGWHFRSQKRPLTSCQ